MTFKCHFLVPIYCLRQRLDHERLYNNTRVTQTFTVCNANKILIPGDTQLINLDEKKYAAYNDGLLYEETVHNGL